MMFLFFAVALATKCTFDSSRESTEYTTFDNYHERYCNHACPCDGAEDGCEMDFTFAPHREIYNTTGKIDTLTTRDYEFTFAVNVPANSAYTIGKTVMRAARMHYKLQENTVLTVGTQETDPEYAEATLTTIVRCNTSCTVKDSTFPKKETDQISFMPEKVEDGFIESKLTLENVVFHVQSASGHFEQNFARDQLTVTMKNVKFVVEEDVTNVNVIGLFYAAIPTQNETVSVELKNNPTNAKFNIEKQCDGKWIVAVKEGTNAQLECTDPTIALGDAELEDACEVAFIVIIVLADVALFTIIAIFVVLIVIGVIKKKKSQKYQEI